MASFLDRVSLEVSGNITAGNIGKDYVTTLTVMDVAIDNYIFDTHTVLTTQRLSPKGEISTLVTSIDSADFTDNSFLQMSLQLSLEIVQMFADDSSSIGVRSSAFLYYNITDLFPRGRPEDSNE